MGRIAREAGVPKGTLYVYFDRKEALFRAVVVDLQPSTAERLADLDRRHEGLETALSSFAARLLAEVLEPGHVALLRMVVAVSERFPHIGRTFYEAGPLYGAQRLAEHLTLRPTRGEIALDGWYDYAAKYETDAAELKVPADELHPATVARLKSLSAEAFRLLRMSGMARVDFRILDKQVGYESAGRIYINEVNSIPGFTSISMYPKLFDLAGIGLPHLLDELVQAALRQAAAPQPRAAKAQV